MSTIQGKFQGLPIVGPPFPSYSHKNPLKYGNGMGSLGEGGPIIGGPLEKSLTMKPFRWFFSLIRMRSFDVFL